MTRIIGGADGGRRLRVPSGSATRPTSDRVREALFSALESAVGPLDGLRFLDLYAGSGAVGLEAMSRGAAALTLVERDRRTASLIRDNARSLGYTDIEVVAAAVSRTLAEAPTHRYDVAFIDPPYSVADEEVTSVLTALVERRWLAEDAVVVVERPRRGAAPQWPRGLAGDRARTYGETTLWYGHAAGPVPPTPSEVEEPPVRRAVCPGSFDPVTNGHIDIISRASALFDEVTVAIGVNQSKNRLFGTSERIEMLTESCRGFDNVRIDTFEGLLVDFCRERGIQAIVKGLRAVSDFDYELQMAQMNSSLAQVETVFIPTSPEYSFLASSLVKEVAAFGGDVTSLVPEHVLARMTSRLEERRRDGD